MKSREGSLTAAVVPRKPDAKTTAQSTLVNITDMMMRSLFFFLQGRLIDFASTVAFVLAFLPIVSGHLQYIKRCDNIHKGLTVQVFDNAPSSLYDIYAIGWRMTCGSQAGTITGNGTKMNPYLLTIDLSRGLAWQTPKCGVQEVGNNTYRLGIKSIRTCERPTFDDPEYSITCILTNIPSSKPPALIHPPLKVVANVSHVCHYPDLIQFFYSQREFQPFDIYAINGRQACSKCSGAGTGTGSQKDPYVLSINITDPTQFNACQGEQVQSKVYNLKILVQQAEFIIQNTDTIYNIECDFNRPDKSSVEVKSGLSVAGKPPTKNATKESTRAILNVVASDGITPVRTVSIGDHVRLKLTVESNAYIAGLRVRQCDALPDWNAKTKLPVLNDQGCPTSDWLIPPFYQVSEDANVAITGIFKAFKFSGFSTIYFRCNVEYCHNLHDKRCSQIHCRRDTDRSRRSKNKSEKMASTIVAIQNVEAMNLQG